MAYPSNDGPDLNDDLTGDSDQSYRATSDELRQFIERVERLESDKKDIQEDIKEVYAEAKSRGYNVKVMRQLVRDRKRDKDDLAEEEAVREMYREALGDI